jgi:hypothetical protein
LDYKSNLIRMAQTRKQRGAAIRKPAKMTLTQRRKMERMRPIGYEKKKQKPERLLNWFKPNRPRNIVAEQANIMMTQTVNRTRGIRPRKTINLGTLNIRRNASASDYVKSVKSILYKVNEILRDPSVGDYETALEIADKLKAQLNDLEDSLGSRRSGLDKEPNEIIERVIYLIGKYQKPAKQTLIAVTVDDALTKAKSVMAPPAAEEEVDELTAMLGSLKPFRA